MDTASPGYTLDQLLQAAGEHDLAIADGYAYAAEWVARTTAPDRRPAWTSDWHIQRLRGDIAACQALLDGRSGTGYVLRRAGPVPGEQEAVYVGRGNYLRLFVPLNFVAALVGVGNTCHGFFREAVLTDGGSFTYPGLLVVRDGVVMAANFGCGFNASAGYREAIARGEIPLLTRAVHNTP